MYQTFYQVLYLEVIYTHCYNEMLKFNNYFFSVLYQAPF